MVPEEPVASPTILGGMVVMVVGVVGMAGLVGMGLVGMRSPLWVVIPGVSGGSTAGTPVSPLGSAGSDSERDDDQPMDDERTDDGFREDGRVPPVTNLDEEPDEGAIVDVRAGEVADTLPAGAGTPVELLRPRHPPSPRTTAARGTASAQRGSSMIREVAGPSPPSPPDAVFHLSRPVMSPADQPGRRDWRTPILAPDLPMSIDYLDLS